MSSGCSQERESAEDTSAISSQEEASVAMEDEEQDIQQTEVTYDNLPLCSNDKVDISLKSISNEGVTLNITNKTDEVVTISQVGIALDGQCLMDSGYALLWEDLVPNSTLEHLIQYDLNDVEHQTISGMFELYDMDENGNGTSSGYLGFSDIALGYEAHPIWAESPDAQILYEDEHLSCSFYRIMGSKLALSITNKSFEQFSVLFDNIAVNGQTITSTSSNGADILPDCEGILIVELLDFNLETELESGGTVAGIIDIFHDHIGTGEFSFNVTM